MTELDLVPDKSRVRIRTFAEGFLARLAHDLELVSTRLSGRGERSGRGSGKANVELAVGALDVSGTLAKNGGVDARGLSAADRRLCLQKMRDDVFQASSASIVRAEATLDGESARLRFVLPNGSALERTANVRVSEDGPEIRVTGTLALSLAAIGSKTVKGPMNAFRVKDEVEIHFDVVFSSR